MKCRIPVNDLAQKLDSTICRYKGHPYLIRVDGTSLHLYSLTNTKNRLFVISYTDDDFDIAGLPLGYMQSGDYVPYLSRSPLRRTKQGLDARALKIRNNNRNNNPGTTVNSLLYSQGFVDMILNQYPSLNDCITTIRGKWMEDPSSNASIAVSRNVCLSIDKVGIVKVYYKTDYVGWIEPDKFIVHVPSNDMGWVVSKFLSHELSWEID